MTFSEYLDSIHEKTVAVIGIGVSNRPLIEALARAGVAVTACDKKSREDLGEYGNRLEAMGVRLHLGPDYLKGLRQDIIFRTPGMRPDVPELLEAAAHGSEITSEMEVFFRVCPCPIIGVTGSDGKTTTTTIIAELLRRAGRTVHLGGNIGHPLLTEAGEMRGEDIAVLELSSFQLLTMTKQSPHIAVLTNLAPNHLDVHRDMAEYVAAKENIFTHQTAEDLAIFNADNAITRELSGKAAGSVRMFSRKEEPAEGVFLRGDAVISRRDGAERQIMTTADIRLPGVHNVENYLAAIAAVDGLVPDGTIRDFARSFGGVEHRIELVRTLRGVRYYNDSIATSPSRCIAGLRSFDRKVILIAGGYDKHIPFDVLGPEIVAHVKLLVLCGATAEKIRQAVVSAPGYAEGAPEIILVKGFREAVETASARAVEGDVVTLSPACAAFDQFANFMERGRAYKQIISELQ